MTETIRDTLKLLFNYDLTELKCETCGKTDYLEFATEDGDEPKSRILCQNCSEDSKIYALDRFNVNLYDFFEDIDKTCKTCGSLQHLYVNMKYHEVICISCHLTYEGENCLNDELIDKIYEVYELEDKYKKEVRKEVENEFQKEQEDAIKKKMKKEVRKEVENEFQKEQEDVIKKKMKQELDQEIFKKVEKDIRDKTIEKIRKEIENNLRPILVKEIKAELKQSIKQSILKEMDTKLTKFLNS